MGKKLGRTIAPGTFGDNLTISGIASPDVAIGDRLHCRQSGSGGDGAAHPLRHARRKRMEDKQFVKAFRYAERPGVYCRVIGEGEVAAGTPVTHEPYAGERLGIMELYRDWYVRKKLSASDLRRTLAAPIAIRTRREYEELLNALETPPDLAEPARTI